MSDPARTIARHARSCLAYLQKNPNRYIGIGELVDDPSCSLHSKIDTRLLVDKVSREENVLIKIKPNGYKQVYLFYFDPKAIIAEAFEERRAPTHELFDDVDFDVPAAQEAGERIGKTAEGFGSIAAN